MIGSTKQRRLLIVTPISSWGGASVGLLTVINALELAGCYEFVLLFNKRGPAFDKFTELGYECQVCSFPTIGNAGGRDISLTEFCKFLFELPFTMLRLLSLLKKGDFDCVYLNTGVCLAPALVGKILGIPIVWHIRELLGSSSLLSRWHCSLIASVSDLVIVNSESSGSAMGNATNCSLIYDGISEEFEENISDENAQQIKVGWGFTEDVFVVGLVAAISWSKGHLILLEALTHLVADFPMLRVVLVGGTVTPSNYYKTLRARVKKMLGGYSDAEAYLKIKVKDMGLEDFVLFDGWQSGKALVDRICAMDVMAFPSTIPEGFGRPVAEASLLGKPSIGTDCGSLPELIKHGLTGWLVPPNDAKQLSESMREAIAHPDKAQLMGDRARTLALHKFTMSIHNKKIIEALDNVSDKVSKI